MATTNRTRIGRTRIKLCQLLNKTFPEWHFEPENLWSQIPYYARSQQDCCSWGADGVIKDNPRIAVSVASWDTMTQCVKKGIAIYAKEHLSAEVCIMRL